MRRHRSRRHAAAGPASARREHPLILLGVLQLWLVMIALVLSPDSLASLREWIGEWFRASLIFLVAIGAGRVMASEPKLSSRLSGLSGLSGLTGMLIVVPVALLALVHCILAVKYYSPESYRLVYFGLGDHRANITHAVSLGLPVILIDLYERLRWRRYLLPVPSWLSVLMLLVLLTATATSSTRNGILVVTIVVAAWCLWMFYQMISADRTRASLALFVTCGAAIISGLAISVATDPRWDRLADTVKVAWHYDEQTAWYRFPSESLPITTDGREIDESAYLRIAFAKEGARLFIENLLGTGMGRDAFKVLVAQKYQGADVAHTHIGVLDLGLSAGLLGLVLWFSFLACLGYLGWREARLQKNPLGLVLTLGICVFSLRTLVDSTLRDHILEQFMLMTGLLVATSVGVNDPKTRD